MAHDVVIRGGTLVDGTGGPARTADVAVDGGMITEVGEVTGRGAREIDADGALVTPGVVDVHTHYDAQATWDPQLTPSGHHGVTTVVMGNCGVGFAPAAADRRDWLIGLMEGVEDIPGTALHDGIDWQWESFPEYLDALEAKRWVMDVGTQVPHGALRAHVMGERGAANEPAGTDDIAEMSRLVLESLRAGALGFSTSRTPIHRSIDGELVPGTTATAEELFGIGDALAQAGHGLFQYAPEHVNIEAEFEWMVPLAERTGRPVVFNLNQTDQRPDMWRTAVQLCADANARGLPVLCQVAGRAVGVLLGWECALNPFVGRPSWGLLALETGEARRAKALDPRIREQILAEDDVPIGDFVTFMTTTFDRQFVFGGDVDYEPGPEQSVAAVAAAQGRSPQEVAYDALCEDAGRGLLYFPLFNYADGDLGPTWALHQHPSTRMGLADAGAHCGAVCDGGMPTFMLSYWARDRAVGPRLPLELVVHRQTRQTSELYGLMDRGVVAPGFRADLNVIDFDGLRATKPELVFDLPSGARRLMQRAEGYLATFCAGVQTVADDEFTGDLPGRLLRGPQRPRELRSVGNT